MSDVVTRRPASWTCVTLALTLVMLAMGAGCTRPNPLYRGPAEAGAGDTAQDDAGPGDAAADGTTDLAADRASDVPRDRASDVKIDTNGDIKADAGDGGFVCVTAADCTARSAPPCGAWECRNSSCVLNCPNCTDGDGDGYGVGIGCAGPDCDDADPTIQASGVRSCPTGAVNKGTCRAGTQSCTAGAWTTCSGQIVATGEACNGEDDDCNGTSDDGLPSFTCGLGACQNTVPSCSAGLLAACVPHITAASDDATCDGIDDDCDGQIDEDCPTALAACIHVSPDGDDDTGDGSVGAPFLTIPKAIATAALPTTPSKNVCVAGGQTCSDRTTYTVGDTGNFVMSNGVSVFGNYQWSDWTRCPLDPATPDPLVTINLREAGGVRFPAAITTTTTLDGFVLARNNFATVTGVTVNGAKQVRLVNLVINDSPQATRSYGVNMTNGAEALITHCLINGGAGTAETYGVRSSGAKPTIRENCSAPDPITGRCNSTCADAPGLGIGGRINPSNTGLSAAVLLDTSAGASIETSTLCGQQGAQAMGVHLIGAAAGTVIRGNSISASTGSTTSLGVLAEDCLEAAPWIVGNHLIEGQGAMRAAGILAVGACRPVIDGNTWIRAGGDINTTEADGVSCEANTGGEGSLCAVLGNAMIQGSTTVRAGLTAAGVACKDQGCVRVAQNIVTGSSGNDVIGIWLQNDGATVQQNRIVGGCGLQSAAGILADDSFARIENNVVSGGLCQAPLGASPLSVGLRVYGADGPNELDVHSNSIDGGGNTGLCTSVAVEYGAGANSPPTTSKGIYRNNILRAGACNTRIDFSEVLPACDPRLFENNDLDPTGSTVLYFNEDTTSIRVAATVNALTDTGAHNNLGVNPMFVNFPTDLHLGPGSACIGAGTPTGAPAADYDDKARSVTHPTIGAFE